MTICTLTMTDDYQGEYEDDLWYRRELSRHIQGPLGANRLARDVVTLLHRWVANYPQCRRDELMVLGEALYEIAFGGEVGNHEKAPLRKAFEETLEACRRENRILRLRLVLKSGTRELATYPWEFLYMDDPAGGNGFFLAGEDTRLTLTRYVPNSETWEQSREEEDQRLRILVVRSTPNIPDMTDLHDVGEFVNHLLELDKSRFNIVLTDTPTKTELTEKISEILPHVIHFIGHGKDGTLALRKDDDTLAAEREEFEDQQAQGGHPAPLSEAAWVDPHTASIALRSGLDDPIAPKRLIFLHACEGATAKQNRMILGTFGDVARSLASYTRISGVIAMQYTIGVDEAELFAKSFYRSISDGARLDEAVRAARKEFAETPLRGRQQSWDSRGFGTPVSYLRREEALIARPRLGKQQSQVEKTYGLDITTGTRSAVSEPCPNSRCGGFVLRSSQPPKCRVCQEPFSVCPRCQGLVVPKPGYQCRDCPYVFQAVGPEVAERGAAGQSRLPAAVAHFEARGMGDLEPEDADGFTAGPESRRSLGGDFRASQRDLAWEKTNDDDRS
jgi:hypothetical protein